MKVLIIEDNPDTQQLLKNRLKEKGFAVNVVADGEQGSYYARTNNYDLILLDCGLPKKNGVTVAKEIRSQNHEGRKHTPIIMISVEGEIPEKIDGLSAGADDYVTKPFFFDEVFARMQTVLRRPAMRESAIITIADVVIDIEKQSVTRGGRIIYLTRKEFTLLEYLARHRGQVVSRGMIAEHVWDMNVDAFSHTIETHIMNLRKKIDADQPNKLIQSVPGRGYKMDLFR